MWAIRDDTPSISGGQPVRFTDAPVFSPDFSLIGIPVNSDTQGEVLIVRSCDGVLSTRASLNAGDTLNPAISHSNGIIAIANVAPDQETFTFHHIETGSMGLLRPFRTIVCRDRQPVHALQMAFTPDDQHLIVWSKSTSEEDDPSTAGSKKSKKWLKEPISIRVFQISNGACVRYMEPPTYQSFKTALTPDTMLSRSVFAFPRPGQWLVAFNEQGSDQYRFMDAKTGQTAFRVVPRQGARQLWQAGTSRITTEHMVVDNETETCVCYQERLSSKERIILVMRHRLAEHQIWSPVTNWATILIKASIPDRGILSGDGRRLCIFRRDERRFDIFSLDS